MLIYWESQIEFECAVLRRDWAKPQGFKKGRILWEKLMALLKTNELSNELEVSRDHMYLIYNFDFYVELDPIGHKFKALLSWKSQSESSLSYPKLLIGGSKVEP